MSDKLKCQMRPASELREDDLFFAPNGDMVSVLIAMKPNYSGIIRLRVIDVTQDVYPMTFHKSESVMVLTDKRIRPGHSA